MALRAGALGSSGHPEVLPQLLALSFSIKSPFGVSGSVLSRQAKPTSARGAFWISLSRTVTSPVRGPPLEAETKGSDHVGLCSRHTKKSVDALFRETRAPAPQETARRRPSSDPVYHPIERSNPARECRAAHRAESRPRLQNDWDRPGSRGSESRRRGPSRTAPGRTDPSRRGGPAAPAETGRLSPPPSQHQPAVPGSPLASSSSSAWLVAALPAITHRQCAFLGQTVSALGSPQPHRGGARQI